MWTAGEGERTGGTELFEEDTDVAGGIGKVGMIGYDLRGRRKAGEEERLSAAGGSPGCVVAFEGVGG